MPKRLPSKLKRMLFNYDWEIVEIQGSMFKIFWGIWLMIPFNTFSGSSSYKPLESITTEFNWGMIIFLLGSTHLLSMAYGGVKLRRHLIMLSCGFWVFLSVIFIYSRVASGIIPLTIVISFFLAVNYLRLGLPDINPIIKRRLGYDKNV